ncbi:hypothetical protein [Bacillus mobilis]
MSKNTLKEFMILLGILVVVLGVIMYNGIRERESNLYKPLRQD